MKKILYIVIIIIVAAFFFPKSYISSPGFVAQETAAEFDRTKPTCLGWSYLTNAEAMAADASGKSFCFGWLKKGK